MSKAEIAHSTIAFAPPEEHEDDRPERSSRRGFLKTIASAALTGWAAGAIINARRNDPRAAAWLAGMRALGHRFWLVRDPQTGSLSLRGCYSVDIPEGMSEADCDERDAGLRTLRDETPNMKQLVIDELRREGLIIQIPVA